MRSRPTAVIALAASALLAACSSGERPLTLPPVPGATISSPGSSTASPGTGTSQSPGTNGDPNSTLAGGASPAARGTGPSPFAYPWTPSPDVPVDATVTPRCVQRGGLVTVKVHTKPAAGIAYIAMYSDGGNGAPKPYGNGYGGNDKGISNANGDWSNVFTVSPTAPSGPARVDVIVGWNQMWGYDGPTFAVAEANGRC